MRIRSLEIQGFKTFPDKTVLQLQNGITAVVGPNGSGKSNLSDAVRWVLGEQNVRTLRCTKMEDVIFNGTPQRKAQGYAEVTLNIDNTDRALAFDKDEVAVTRRYYRSGESEYLLNHVAMRLKDINELFMDTGLGRDGYSIIGQGKIDAIVSAKSEDRREIFEEAAGISRCRYRKEDSERQLSAAEDNLVRLNDILAELKGRVDPLKEQSEKAQKFVTYSNEKKDLQIAFWLRQMDQSDKALHTHDDKIMLARTQQEKAEKELNALDRAAEQNFQKITGCAAQIDEVRQQSSSKEEAAAQKDSEAAVLDSDVRHGRETVGRLETELAAASQGREHLQQEAAEKAAKITEQNQQETQLLQSEDDVNKKLESLRAKIRASSADAEDISQQLSQLASHATESKVAEMTAASAMSEIAVRVSHAASTISGKEELFNKLQDSRKDSSQTLADMQARIQDMRISEQQWTQQLQQHRRQTENQKQKADRLQIDARESIRRASLLESLEQNMEGFSRSVKVIMQASARGTISGICGPVSRLITVPPAYTVALETALGASMQHIVVQTEQNAKDAIRMLKHRDAGRATFLPLGNLRSRVLQEPSLKDCEGFVGVASELCTSEPTYRGVRENLLGRIAVARDLDAAVEIARRFHYRFRVVTLDGQVVNTGGSLTGGSLARNSGLLSRRSEIARTREKAQAQTAEAEKAAAAYQNCMKKDAAAEAELSALRSGLAARQEDCIRMKANCTQLEKDISNVQKDICSLKAEQATVSQRLSDQKQKQAEARKQSSLFAEQMAALRQKAKELTDSCSSLEQQSESCTAQLQQLRLQLLSVRKDRENLQEALQQLEIRQQESTSQADTLQMEIREQKALIVSAQQKAATAREAAVHLHKEAAAGSSMIEQINQHRMQLEQQDTRLRQQQRNKSDEKETIGHELTRLEERRTNLQRQYDGLAAKLWDEYELTRREAQKSTPLLQEADMPQAQRRLNELKGLIRALGTVNVAAIEEYKEVSKRYEFLSVQIEDVEKSRGELRQLIRDLTHQMQEQFTLRFSQIRRNFTETFRELFGGGTASLELSNPDDILTSGIDITVQPPGKIVSHLESLSGGEKALVAIALYFAIMKVSPPPFCMLDEIDAALDDVNVSRFAAYLRRMSQNTQFIVITHRRGCMEEADTLYGVTMQDEGISQVLVLHPNEIVAFNHDHEE